MRVRARLGWLAALALAMSCTAKPSPGERERAVVEGRNLAGSSARSRDDRIPELVGEAIGPERGSLPGAFAYASAPASVLGWALARSTADPELTELLAAHPSARVHVSMSGFGDPLASLHLRVHVGDPELGAALLGWLRRGLADGQQTCTELDRRLRWCAGSPADRDRDRDRDRLDLAHVDEQGQLIVDRLWVLGTGDQPDDRQRAQMALDRVSGAAPVEVEGLRGAAVGWIDASVLLDPVGPALARSFGADPAALERLVPPAEARLFDALTIEAALADGRLLGRLRWAIAAGAEARATELFSLDPVDADVPTLASLCAGQRVCVRARGLPVAGRYAGLGVGLYADPAALAEAVAAAPELAAVTLAVTSWPHAIAALLRWPAGARDTGEALVRNTVAEIAGRVLGFGLAHGDAGTLIYARLHGLDLARVRDYLDLAGAGFRALEPSGALAEVDGRIEAGATPGLGPASAGRWRLPRRSYAHFDPGEGWGWLVLADDDAQLAWLAARPHDDGAVPIVYVELADLGDVTGVAALAGTPLRAQLSATAARVPELRVAIGAAP